MNKIMRQWQLPGFGRENLRIVEVLVPQPKAHEVLIKVRAVSLNNRDRQMIDNGMGMIFPLPLVPASDMSGEVIAIGHNVTRFKKGDAVLPGFWLGWIEGQWPNSAKTLGGPLPGTLSEYIVLDEQHLVAAPRTLNHLQTSTLSCAALTAWFALMEENPLRPGQSVLIHGTGGVALFGVQFAAAQGANVIVVSSSDEKLQQVKKLGASHCIHRHHDANWPATVRELTAGKGVDHVLEIAGGENLSLSLQALAQGGRISLIGVLNGYELRLPTIPLFLNRPTIQGVGVGHRRALEDMIQAIDHINLQPVISGEYKFDELQRALDHLESGPFGKVVLNFD